MSTPSMAARTDSASVTSPRTTSTCPAHGWSRSFPGERARQRTENPAPTNSGTSLPPR